MNRQCQTFMNSYGERWLHELVSTRGVTRLMAPHNQLLDEPNTDDLQLCWEVLASAEVVAACYSHNHDRIPPSAQRWLNRRQGLYARRCKITSDQALKAYHAAQIVLNNPKLKNWCCCNSCGSQWLTSQQELLGRLTASSAVAG